MIKSMTGFSKTEATGEGIKVTTEIKSLNGKGLDLNFRIPRQIQHREMEMREFFRNNVSRGSLTVSISVEADDTSAPKFAINKEVADECYNELNAMRKQFKIKEAINMQHMLAFASQLSHNDVEFDEDQVLKLLNKTLLQGLKALDAMKVKEGQNIAKDIVRRIKNVQDLIAKIEEISRTRIPQERERLRSKIAQLFDSDEIDEHRLQMEIVMLADKLDVSEECVRLSSHFKFFAEALQAKEPAGRKINFLLQEINREVNTIGSKANDATISQYIVNAKEELERIREQIQNAE
jgi:uncharacterized protein (TIGR00255 family)